MRKHIKCAYCSRYARIKHPTRPNKMLCGVCARMLTNCKPNQITTPMFEPTSATPTASPFELQLNAIVNANCSFTEKVAMLDELIV